VGGKKKERERLSDVKLLKGWKKKNYWPCVNCQFFKGGRKSHCFGPGEGKEGTVETRRTREGGFSPTSLAGKKEKTAMCPCQERP